MSDEHAKDLPWSYSLWWRCRREGCTGHARLEEFASQSEAASSRTNHVRTKAAWLPSGCQGEVGPIEGPGLAREGMSPSEWSTGMQQVRDALAKCSGPLFKGTKKPTGTPGARRDPVDQSEYEDPNDERYEQ